MERIQFDGNDYLAYKTFPINVAILRGTTADTDGNITMEKEALTLEALAIATAARNSGGFVIVQVERVAGRGTLNARQVKIPGIMVDCVVVSEPEHHWQTFGTQYDPSFSSEIKVPIQSLPPMEMGDRKIIARRAAFELVPNSVVNLGIGMPEGVSNVANEEKIIEFLTLTAEPGVIGGLPAGGLNFGAAVNTEALIDQPSQFDFYDGGGLDLAFLGLAQADEAGGLGPARESQCEQVWTQAGRCRRFYQHQPVRQAGRLRGNVYRRWPEDFRPKWQVDYRPGRQGEKVR